MPRHLSHKPSANGAGHGQVEEVVNDAIPVADEDSVRGAQVRIALWGQVKGSDAQPGGGNPRPPPTYLLSVELHEAHQVAIFLESNKEVHH